MAPFVRGVSAPFLAANLDASGEPLLYGNFSSSTLVNVGSETVGIIGYVTKETPNLVPKGMPKASH